ncbi:MAG: hypothetical protein NTNFB02_16650 [Nitrospira sp.]
MKTIHVARVLAVGITVGVSAGAAIGAGFEPAAGESPSGTVPIGNREQVITQQTKTQLAGNRLVTGHVKDIRGNQMEVDIGNPKALYIPLKPTTDKGHTFKPGELVVITLNDHNALVDFHHQGETLRPQIYVLEIATPDVTPVR